MVAIGKADLPTRRSIVAGVLVAILAAVAVASPKSSPAQGAEPPNVVVIMTDDQTAESMRVMTQTQALIGDQGASFSRSYVNLPLCCPSRATFLTGLYAHNHEVTTNVGPNGGFYKFDATYGESNLATWLEGAGYHTALVGKYMNEYGDRAGTETQVPAGWSEWYATLKENPAVYDYRLNQNSTVVNYGSAVEDYKTDVLTATALDVIAARTPAPEPLFLWLSYTAPHRGGPEPSPQPPTDCDPGANPAPRHANAFDTQPLPGAPSFNEADVSDKPPSIQALPELDAAAIETVERRYRCGLEALLAVDEGVAKVVAELSAAGELDETIIVFTSDNGFFYGEHRIRAGKGEQYEPSVRVPLLIRGPGVPAGTSPDELVINADLAPTILDAAGLAPPLEPDGLSLLPLLAGGQFPRGELLIENRSYAAVRNDRYVYVEHTAGPDNANPSPDAGAIELYDLIADPHELESLHDDPAYDGIETQLAERLAALRSCRGASCQTTGGPTEPPPSQPPPSEPPADPPPSGSAAETAGADGGNGADGPAPGEPGATEPVDSGPPQTTIVKRPGKRISARRVKFKFASDEPDSTFECRVDKRRWRACDSARSETLRVGLGRHRFQVVATDSAGNTDPKPAGFRFRRS